MDLDKTEGFKNRRVFFLLFLVIVLGAAFRFWGLDIQSFWNDELHVWHIIHQRSTLNAVVENVARLDGNPPAYHLLLYSVSMLGVSQAILRSPSVFFGVLSIGVIFLLGRRLYTWREGLLAALLMSLLKCPVYYSQEARPYAMLLFFTLVTVYLWLHIVDCLRKNTAPSVKNLVAYVTCAAVLCYVHYYGVFLIVLQGILLLFFCRIRKSFVCFGFVYGTILMAYVPWLSVFELRLNVHPMTLWIDPPRGIVESFGGFIKFLFNDSLILATVFIVLCVCMLVRGCCRYFQDNDGNEIFLIGWLVVPFLGVFLVSYFTPLHILENRYLIISLPAAYLLAARAVVLLPLSAVFKRSSVVALAVFLIWDLIFRLQYYSIPSKEQFREAVNFVIQHDGHFKDSIIVGSVWNEEYLDYYFRRGNSHEHVGYLLINQRQREALFRTFSHTVPADVWYIHMNVSRDNEFLIYMSRLMRLAVHKEFIGGSVYLFQKRETKDGS
ncbi:MAG: glycosyltransferase family 39 protein [Candidatus Omnitrophica bacterium]|nr:glycosyltransferase family 39 protein [Candidatus Omnitrophota bacterium]